MKKIYKEIERIILGNRYNYYRLIITPKTIELKLSPKNNNDDEVNWIKDNDKDDRDDLLWQLKTIS